MRVRSPSRCGPKNPPAANVRVAPPRGGHVRQSRWRRAPCRVPFPSRSRGESEGPRSAAVAGRGARTRSSRRAAFRSSRPAASTVRAWLPGSSARSRRRGTGSCRSSSRCPRCGRSRGRRPRARRAGNGPRTRDRAPAELRTDPARSPIGNGGDRSGRSARARPTGKRIAACGKGVGSKSPDRPPIPSQEERSLSERRPYRRAPLPSRLTSHVSRLQAVTRVSAS